ncbi:MAG: peptidase C39 [Novipirellula sp. JB048]
MASDLGTAIAVMSVISSILGLAAGGYLYSSKGQRTMLALSVAVLGMVYFQFYAAGQLFWARLVPLSAAIIYTNFAAFFAALAAGWAWRLPNTPLWRRWFLSAALALGAVAAITWPLLSIALRPPPAGDDDVNQPIAMQTSWATCSPAAAATLFRAEGIAVSESEMIPLCLTDASGTPTLGLYRGIKLIAQRYDREVEVLQETLEEMLTKDDWPVLLTVQLPYGIEDRRYADQWGWIPGMGHTVVALDRLEDGRVVVGDPSVGVEVWSKADMRLLWHGGGIRIQ